MLMCIYSIKVHKTKTKIFERTKKPKPLNLGISALMLFHGVAIGMESGMSTAREL